MFGWYCNYKSLSTTVIQVHYRVDYSAIFVWHSVSVLETSRSFRNIASAQRLWPCLVAWIVLYHPSFWQLLVPTCACDPFVSSTPSQDIVHMPFPPKLRLVLAGSDCGYMFVEIDP